MDAPAGPNTEPHCDLVSATQSGQGFPAYVALFCPYVGSTPFIPLFYGTTPNDAVVLQYAF